jgi:Lipocalin-like domain
MNEKADAGIRLVGAWSLVSWQIFDDNNAGFTEPFGADPHGMLQYTDDGCMSAVVCRSERASLPPGISPRRMDPAQLADCYRSYFHYAGRWHIEGDSVIHSVEFGLNPNMVGTRQVRQMNFAGNTLTLTGIEILGPQQRRHVLLWQRVKPKNTDSE